MGYGGAAPGSQESFIGPFRAVRHPRDFPDGHTARVSIRTPAPARSDPTTCRRLPK